MIAPILAGIETEYGLLVQGRGAEDQVDDATALARAYPGDCSVGWDYRHESPRTDLRGFSLKGLAFDPEDRKFDEGRARGPDHEVRADRILPNGARFYNDHGHPEYATPECSSLRELALHDKAGELAVLRAARALAEREKRDIRVYKNNTDFHGASYGTHESYLVPRRLGFDRLFRGVTPMLVARQVITASGKVGAEAGRSCVYQLSQRADFLTEAANAETLYRRPVFNTRDEPHADRADWIRLHVISGDANMMAACTARKVGLVKLSLLLEGAGEAPCWRLRDPVAAFKSVSRDESGRYEIELEGRSWTTAPEIIESYLAAAEVTLDLDEETASLVKETRSLLGMLSRPRELAAHVDWAAKRLMLEAYMESEGSDWRDPALRSFDLEYHNVDRQSGLFYAIQEMGQAPADPGEAELATLLEAPPGRTRAIARGIAVKRFKDRLATACWRSLNFEINGKIEEVELPPDREYSPHLKEAGDVITFIRMLRGEK